MASFFFIFAFSSNYVYSHCSSEEGGDQQSNIYGMMSCMCCIIFGVDINTTAYRLGQYSLHILLEKELHSLFLNFADDWI